MQRATKNAEKRPAASIWGMFYLLAAVVGVASVFLGQQSTPWRVVIFECEGGTDKNPETGRRTDTDYLLEELDRRGVKAELLRFADADADALHEAVLGSGAHAFVSRVDPGLYPHCTLSAYDAFLRQLAAAGLAAFNHPDEMASMGSKAALLELSGMACSQNDTFLYRSTADFASHFPFTLLHGDRVVKQNRGSKGEGIWRVQLDRSAALRHHRRRRTALMRRKARRRARESGRRRARTTTETAPQEAALLSRREAAGILDLSPHTPLFLTEAKDNRVRKQTLDEFMRFCEQYLAGDDGLIVNQAYLQRIAEGEVRLIMSGRRPVYLVERLPASSPPGVDAAPANLSGRSDEELRLAREFPNALAPFSANLGAAATHRYMMPEAMPDLVRSFVGELDTVFARMGVTTAPLLWTVDFIRDGPAHDTSFVISEINCSCVGFSAHKELAADIVDALLVALSERSESAKSK